MAAININKGYTMPREELKEQLNELAEKLEQKFQLDCSWQSDDCLGFKRSGADGQLNIREQDLELRINLGFLLQAFKGTIEQQIQEFIDEHIY